MPGLVKIGMTTQEDIDKRMKERLRFKNCDRRRTFTIVAKKIALMTMTGQAQEARIDTVVP